MAKLWNRRDVDFLLYDVLKIQELNRFEHFADHDRETFNMILDAAEQLAHEEFLPTNKEGDEHGTVYDNGNVKLPESFRKLARLYAEGGWMQLMDDYEDGGQQAPHSIAVAAGTAFGAANHSFLMFPGLSQGAANLIRSFGTERQKKLYMEPIFSLRYGGTMCLTEPQAGTDVGNLSTVARRNEDGTYSIKGQKIFISWGDHDLAENIVHPVLARIEGDPAGTKGISIFLVPKYRVNEDGSLGEHNDVTCSGVEHKLGIHASPTCQLVFGENDNCIGELLGEERQGMKIMFQMMNGARLETGMQGLTCSEPAYQYALEYAYDRKQGSSIKEFKNAEAPRVSISEHPNVRRMLLDMKAKVEGMRALLYYTALQIDLGHVAEGAEAEAASDRLELLTPIAKAWCSDVGFDVNETAIQCLGGHGYLADHPLEQYMRDMKIASLYEGTNGVQAMDLLGRKLNMKGGSVFMGLLAEIGETVDKLNASGSFGDEAQLLGRAKDTLGESAMGLGQLFMSGDLALPLLNAKPFLDSMGDVVVSWLLFWEALVAEEKLAAGADPAETQFLQGKIITATHFAHRTLPLTLGRLETIASQERGAMEIVFEGEEREGAMA